MAKEQPTNQFIGVPAGIYTGPSANIGGSAEYHVDVKFVDLHAKGDYATIVKMMDAIALGYKRNGQRMEFSNEGVSGKVWDPSLPQEQKEALARQAIDSHNHSASTGSMDFYIVADKEENRFAPAVASKREMVMPVPVGGKVVYGSSGGYGNFVAVHDANGNEMFTMGHGDNREKLPANASITKEYLQAKVTGVTLPAATSPSTPPTSGTSATDASWLGVQPTEETIKKETEKRGAQGTYDLFGNLFGGNGQEQGGGGGFLMFVVFAMIMNAMQKEEKIDVNSKEDYEKYQTQESRKQRLEQLDKQKQRDVGLGDIPINTTPSTSSTAPTTPAINPTALPSLTLNPLASIPIPPLNAELTPSVISSSPAKTPPLSLAAPSPKSLAIG